MSDKNGAPAQHFSSRVQILLVERTSGKGKDGSEFQRVAARCILLADDDAVITVGRLRVPKALQESVKVGVFRAGFALRVPDYGDSKGDIVAELVSLTPELGKRGAVQP